MGDESGRASDGDLFDLQSFQQVEVEVALENLTTRTSVGYAQRIYGGQAQDPSHRGEDARDLRIHLMEIRDDGISLDVPARSGAQGHSVKLTFDVQGTVLPFSFSAIGVIRGVTPLPKLGTEAAENKEADREKFDVSLGETDKQYFEMLRSVFANRQDEIDRFLAEAKG